MGLASGPLSLPQTPISVGGKALHMNKIKMKINSMATLQQITLINLKEFNLLCFLRRKNQQKISDYKKLI
jgi:hypothetical protein